MEYLISHPQLLWNVATVVFGAGIIYGELKRIRKDISRLEAKQDESNNVKIKQAAMQAIIDIQDKDIRELKQIVYANGNTHRS